MIPLPNVFLIGPTGTGKTTALRSIVRAGLELFVQLTEPHMQILITPHMDWEKAAGIPALTPEELAKVHYSYTPEPPTGSLMRFSPPLRTIALPCSPKRKSVPPSEQS